MERKGMTHSSEFATGGWVIPDDGVVVLNINPTDADPFIQEFDINAYPKEEWPVIVDEIMQAFIEAGCEISWETQ